MSPTHGGAGAGFGHGMHAMASPNLTATGPLFRSSPEPTPPHRWAPTLPSFDALRMNRNARVPRAANRGKRAVSHHNRKAKRPRKGTPTLNKRGR